MKALRFEKFGSPSVLALTETPLPEPKPGEVLVAIKASAINPSDVKGLAGVFHSSLPRIPGRDFAGVVCKGGGAQWEGKEVWGSGAGFGIARDGAHAEYLSIPIGWLSGKPANLSMAQAASIGIPYLVSWQALVNAAGIRKGETVLITGALGSVGRAAVQIAHWMGAVVIGAVRKEGQSEADLLINSATHDLAAEVQRLTRGKGVDLVFDAVGGPLFEPALQSLRLGGRQVAITSMAGPRVEFSLADFYHGLKTLIGVDLMKLGGEEIAQILEQLHDGFSQGVLKPQPVEVWPIEKGVEAYEKVGRGGLKAKQILSLAG